MLMNKSLGKDEFLSVPTMQMYLQKTKKINDQHKHQKHR